MPSSLDIQDTLDSYPLTPLQQGMVYHSLMAPGSGAYIQQFVGHLRENLNVSRFKDAWQRTVAHYPVLKTRLRQDTTGEFFQDLAEDSALEWVEQDWSRHNCNEREDRWLKYLAEDRLRGFDLFEAPLMRMSVIRLSHGKYRFLWTNHHVILDGRSRALVLKDLFGFYDAITECWDYSAGESPAFGDFVRCLMRQDREQARKFWRESLRGFKAATQVVVASTSANTEANKEERGSLDVLLTAEATRKLASFAAANEVTVGTLLHASWAALLARYSDEEDVVFGATRACRHVPVKGVESMVGLLINTVPLRVQVAHDTPIREWLKAIRNRWVAMRPYENTALADIQAWCEFGPQKPLFESILVFEKASFSESMHTQGGSWERRKFEVFEKGTHPLLARGYGRSRLMLQLAFDRSRYDDESAARMLEHWRTLLLCIPKKSDGRISDLSLLTDAEQKTILVDWNNTGHKYPKHLCLHQLFEAQVAKTPDSTAIFFENETLSFSELNIRANRLAHHIGRFGVGPDTLVGICLNRTPSLVVAVLAVLKAGGAYVPLDASYPKAQLYHMLSASGASVLVTQRNLLESLPEHGLKTICVDAVKEDIMHESGSNPKSAVTPGNLAYAIHTSGSTGLPKLIGVEHKSAVNAIFHTTNAVFTAAELSVVPFADSISFDVSVYRIFSPLSVGGGIVLLKSLFDLPYCRWADSITVIGCAPSVLKSFIKDSPLPESVKAVSVGAEVPGDDLLQQLARYPQVDRVINFYGPTETTIYCTYSVLFKRGDAPVEPPRQPQAFKTLKNNIIGNPIWNVRVYILDSHLAPVPLGVAGELCVGGDCLARGYLSQPELTAEKFVADPYNKDACARLYRTGDFARYLPNGNIEFLGRADNQVKIRGLRIESEGVAAVLNRNPTVQECIVRATEDTSGEKQLAAYVVTAVMPVGAAGSVQPSAASLRDYLEEKLPRHMIPAAFVFLDELPRNSTGKVDFNRLPKPTFDSKRPQRSFEPPRTELERILAQIWTEVLSLETVGIHDAFYELGGDSLSATRIVARVNRTLGIELPIRAILDAPTVAKCALAVLERLFKKTGIDDIETVLLELEGMALENGSREDTA